MVQQKKSDVEDQGDYWNQERQCSCLMLVVGYLRGLCSKVLGTEQAGHNKSLNVLKLALLKIIKSVSSTASALLTPTSSPTVIQFLLYATRPPRSVINHLAVDWWRQFYLRPGKEGLPTADLDSLMEFGSLALKNIFASCILVSKEELGRVTQSESRDAGMFTEDCEDGLQMFDDEESDPRVELEGYLKRSVDVVYFREIALEAVES